MFIFSAEYLDKPEVSRTRELESNHDWSTGLIAHFAGHWHSSSQASCEDNGDGKEARRSFIQRKQIARFI